MTKDKQQLLELAGKAFDLLAGLIVIVGLPIVMALDLFDALTRRLRGSKWPTN